MPRLTLRAPFTANQQEVVTLIAQGHDFRACSRLLGLGYTTVHGRALLAAKKIPGDLQDPYTKILVWWRGATLEVLGAGE